MIVVGLTEDLKVKVSFVAKSFESPEKPQEFYYPDCAVWICYSKSCYTGLSFRRMSCLVLTERRSTLVGCASSRK